MKDKVKVLDHTDSQVGETFMRRARQLVKQQRAEWVDNETIRFVHDENTDKSEWKIAACEEESDACVETPRRTDKEALLYYLAEKRLLRRRMFVLHTILMIPGYFACLAFAALVRGDGFPLFMALSFGWTTPYLLHCSVFIYAKTQEYSPSREHRLAMEVDKLRREIK